MMAPNDEVSRSADMGQTVWLPARDICLAGLFHFALERGYVVENVAGRDAGEHEIALTPFAQHAADVFPRHAGHRRQIGVAYLLVEYDALRAGRCSDEFGQL